MTLSSPDKKPKEMLASIERVKGKIASLQVENKHLRSMLEAGVTVEVQKRATEEISRLEEEIKERQRTIHYLEWNMSKLENTFGEINREVESRERDWLEKIQQLDQDTDGPQSYRDIQQSEQDAENTDQESSIGDEQEKPPPVSKAEVSTADGKTGRKWYSPIFVADLANNGFLSFVRSTGKAVGFVQFGTMSGVSKIDQALFSRKKAKKTASPPPREVIPETREEIHEKEKKTEKNREPVENEPAPATAEKPVQEKVFQEMTDEIHEVEDTLENGSEPQMTAPFQYEKHDEVMEEEPLSQETEPEVSSCSELEQPSFPDMAEAMELSESEPSPETREKLPDDDKTGQTESPLSLEELLERNLPQDKIEAIKLRNAVDDLLHGSEAACRNALKTLVSFGRFAEPFLVASLQTDSPRVAEMALKSLDKIGSGRLIDCISDLLASSDPELRIVALRAGQSLTEDQAQPFLERGLRDPSAKVKRRVISYLSWCDSSWALTEIRRVCDDPEISVKWAAIEALLAVRPAEAYDNLELMIPHLPPAYQRRATALLQQRKN